jgi:hypothetical protein
MRSFRPFVFLLFLPAGLGLLMQIAYLPTLSERLLALALGLFCPELARMAWVDLENVAAIAQQATAQQATAQQDSRLSHFYRVLISTIVLELVGFYGALVFLPLGLATVVFSQLWFNLLAGVELVPGENPAIVPLTLGHRRAVLMADGLGLGIISLWSIQSLQIWLAAGLLGLITLFAIVKYGLKSSPSSNPIKTSRKLVNSPDSKDSAFNSAGDEVAEE